MRGLLRAAHAAAAALPDVLVLAAVALITTGIWQQLGRPAGLISLGLACAVVARALARRAA